MKTEDWPGEKMWTVRRQRTRENLGLSLARTGQGGWRRTRRKRGHQERQGKRVSGKRCAQTVRRLGKKSFLFDSV